jgi:hypothetical protein
MATMSESEQFHKINISFGGLINILIQKHFEISKNEEVNKREVHVETLSLIKFILERSQISLNNKEIDQLYSLYVEKYEDPEHGQDLLFTFFLSRKRNGDSILEMDNSRYLFDSIL